MSIIETNPNSNMIIGINKSLIQFTFIASVAGIFMSNIDQFKNNNIKLQILNIGIGIICLFVCTYLLNKIFSQTKIQKENTIEELEKELELYIGKSNINSNTKINLLKHKEFEYDSEPELDYNLKDFDSTNIEYLKDMEEYFREKRIKKEKVYKNIIEFYVQLHLESFQKFSHGSSRPYQIFRMSRNYIKTRKFDEDCTEVERDFILKNLIKYNPTELIQWGKEAASIAKERWGEISPVTKPKSKLQPKEESINKIVNKLPEKIMSINNSKNKAKAKPVSDSESASDSSNESSINSSDSDSNSDSDN